VSNVVWGADREINERSAVAFLLVVVPGILQPQSEEGGCEWVTNFGSSLSGQRFATVIIDGAPAGLTCLPGGPSALNPAGGPSTLTSPERPPHSLKA
jgi:hypothetical protein